MPRKKPRNVLKRKEVDHDLAPNELVNKNKRKKSKFDNEAEGGAAPRGWATMLQHAKLQEERKKQKKLQKLEAKTQANQQKKAPAKPDLKLKPGEKMSDFVRRVDEALPLVRAKGGSDDPKAEKRRRKQKEKAERLAQEHANRVNKKRGRKSGEDSEEEELDHVFERDTSPDPWAKLEAKREKTKFNEVADRPPELKITKRMMNNVPKSAGSMARRAILEEERQRVIDAYRKMHGNGNDNP